MNSTDFPDQYMTKSKYHANNSRLLFKLLKKSNLKIAQILNISIFYRSMSTGKAKYLVNFIRSKIIIMDKNVGKLKTKQGNNKTYFLNFKLLRIKNLVLLFENVRST